MGALKLQYLTDEAGNKISVLMPIELYHELMEQIEELEDIKAYDAVNHDRDSVLPFDQAVQEIEQERTDV